MQSDPPRLHRDQLLAAASALVLLVLLFALKWFGPGAITSSDHATSTVNGWDGLIHLRWLILVTIAFAVMVAALGASTPRSRLRLPFSAILTLLALASLLWLGYRVLISIPPGEKPAAYAGLACALAIFVGGCASLRRELSVTNRRARR
ncbi:MAG: hypothetical protein QOD66_2342 [Solirubrobacteraceae bacterium]|nr:hypothetical protein [Solirubrobacteraceae bacterium]